MIQFSPLDYQYRLDSPYCCSTDKSLFPDARPTPRGPPTAAPASVTPVGLRPPCVQTRRFQAGHDQFIRRTDPKSVG